MATTTPTEFTGTPELTPDKLEVIKNWYKVALRNEDVAADPEPNAYYEGARVYSEAILKLLHDPNVNLADFGLDAPL